MWNQCTLLVFSLTLRLLGELVGTVHKKRYRFKVSISITHSEDYTHFFGESIFGSSLSVSSLSKAYVIWFFIYITVWSYCLRIYTTKIIGCFPRDSEAQIGFFMARVKLMAWPLPMALFCHMIIKKDNPLDSINPRNVQQDLWYHPDVPFLWFGKDYSRSW